MDIAYLILVHTNPNQVARLLSKLKDDVFIHVDKKAKLKNFCYRKDNIIYIKERISINWGGYTMVEATLNLINAAYKKKKYDYYILLSGMDYPIKTAESLKDYLSIGYPCNYIEYEKINKDNYWCSQRYMKYKIFDKNTLMRRIIQKIFDFLPVRRKPYKNLTMYKGSQWWCLSNEGIQYILNYINNNKSVLSYFRHTHIPDEMFFQSILLTGRDLKIENNNLRYIRINDYHPDILKSNDYDKIIKAENKFFARKFDEKIDNHIFNMLDNRMDNNGMVHHVKT